jgi:type II secretory pathway component PulF
MSALFISPGQFTRRAEFYFQLAQFLSAGVDLNHALRHLRQNATGRSYRETSGQLLEQIGRGRTFCEALKGAQKSLPSFDLALLKAGEESGRLDRAFRLLADYYRKQAELFRQVIGGLAYPAFLLHAAVVILPFPDLFLSGDIIAYVTKVATVLLPVYLLVAFIIVATHNERGENWRALIERLMAFVPFWGAARRALALSRLSAALEGLLSAGVNIVEAWPLAAVASGSPQLRRTVEGWRPMLEAGRTPAELVTDSQRFPDLFSSQYAAGEVSGQLDENLERLRDYYQAEGSRKLEILAQWTPRIVYLLIMLVIAWKIIQFWVGYFGRISEIGNF